jgi:hypothetical protein
MRLLLVAGLVLGSLALLLCVPPIAQDPEYHRFADQRTMFGVANFLNVASNLPFLLVGVVGLRATIRPAGGEMRIAWLVLFAAIALVSVGSSYYHLAPTDGTLVWDRLPMSVGFMSLFAALVGEYIGPRLGRAILAPAVLAGIGSVAYWRISGDLRPYVWVQFMPLLALPAILLLFKPRYSHQWLLLASLAGYVLAKLCERFDRPIDALLGHAVSGHSIKHVLSALGCLCLVVLIRRRHPLASSAEALH